jgi:uncharacterized protein
MIIDFHTHLFSDEIKNNRDYYLGKEPLLGELYENPKAKLASAEEIIADMALQNVDISVVQNFQWQDAGLCHETNAYIGQVTAQHPGKLIGFGMCCWDNAQRAVKEIEYCAKIGLKGIGEVRPSTTALAELSKIKPIIESIQENNLILLTHASEPVGHQYSGKGDITPEVLYPFIAAFPGLNLVCAHWGGGLPFYNLMPEVKTALANVYFDSAASPYLYSPEIYSQMGSVLNAERCLFGSDYPLLKPQRVLRDLQSQNLAETIKNKFLAGNALNLLGISL